MRATVPNLFPSITNQEYRIAIVGDAPNLNEETRGIPFQGPSGKLLDGVLSSYGIMRQACLLANVCQYRPPGNDITKFPWDGQEISLGRMQLDKDLEDYKPNLILALGNAALRHFKNNVPDSISSWRGSLFMYNNFKCLATYHPSTVLRQYENIFPFRLDIKKARRQGTTPYLHLPLRNLNITLSPLEIIDKLRSVRLAQQPIALDIEGRIDSMSCLSIATSPVSVFIIPFRNAFWPAELEPIMWRELGLLLGDPLVPKILQNAMYDLFVLQHSYRVPIRGLVDDTMLKHWELLCEAPKSLGFQVSIYTDEPYYKDDRGAEDRTTFYEYCCKDSAVTYEINETLSNQLQGTSKEHYELNVKLLDPLLYMQHRGISYNKVKADARHRELMQIAYRLQWALNELSGYLTPQDWFPICRDAFCFKREVMLVSTIDDILPHCKTTSLTEATRAVAMLKQPSLTLADHGELSVLTEHCLNVESKNQIADFLYRGLQLPIQYKKEKGRLTNKETTDVLALLTLYKKTNDKTLKLILTIRALRTRADVLRASTDPDGRIRCGYNLVGTETGRLSCYESPTGSGFNLQTVTKKDRDLFLPDSDYFLFQCDLSGADGWTVAAHCKNCGDPTMFDDYIFGLKPAKIIALMYLGYNVNSMSRDELKKLCKGIEDGKATELNPYNWLYFGCKRVQHGSNYGMKQNTMSDQILKDSYKLYGEPISIEPTICGELQNKYNVRYPGLAMWHARIKAQIKNYGYLISANGHKRIFFGRRDDHDTFKKACADEPQNNTTYATNLAMYKLWSDSDNRVVDSSNKIQLRIQPLHQVHDALIGQFLKKDSTWAIDKIKSYFANPITIAGQTLTIPFEGAYGLSWGELGDKYNGGNI